MSDITEILGSDIVKDSRADINQNFENLNDDKIETSVIDIDTTLGGASPSDAKLPSQKAVKAYSDSFLNPANTIYPVGSIYMSAVATNPNILFGIGTWVAWGQGRVPVGIGSATVIGTFASRSSNVITITGITNTSSNEFQTGQAVLYSAPSGAITGLTHNTTYYLIRTGNLTFSLATSVINAQAGTAITLSSDGTGVQTFTLTIPTRVAGETGGEANHSLSEAETGRHRHYNIWGTASASGGHSLDYGNFNPDGQVNPTDYAGSSVAHNNMQPFITCYMWQRTA